MLDLAEEVWEAFPSLLYSTENYIHNAPQTGVANTGGQSGCEVGTSSLGRGETSQGSHVVVSSIC